MTSTFQHILVPIDFSEHADRALDYAMAWCRQCHAHLTLIHVIQSLSDVGIDLTPALPAAHLESLEAELTQHMKGYLQRVEDAGVTGDLIMAHGGPFEKTIEVVQARQIDLIIMGSHGRTGVGHLLLGSMAEKLVRLAPCPVLVVR
jgi:nucleotide-binding universal stress UspA family protein